MKTTIVGEREELFPLLSLPDSDAADFDYLTAEEGRELRFVKIHDTWFDVGDTMRIDNDPEWDAYIEDTFFSRYVVKWLEGDDEGFVRVGFQTS